MSEKRKIAIGTTVQINTVKNGFQVRLDPPSDGRVLLDEKIVFESKENLLEFIEKLFSHPLNAVHLIDNSE